MSGSGPLSPIFHGVWQSLQPAIVTRYLPRATCGRIGGDGGAGERERQGADGESERCVSWGHLQGEFADPAVDERGAFVVDDRDADAAACAQSDWWTAS